jgi:hypothetical protein
MGEFDSLDFSKILLRNPTKRLALSEAAHETAMPPDVRRWLRPAG